MGYAKCKGQHSIFSEDLLEYRLMVLEEGKSLSIYIRDIICSMRAAKNRENFECF